MLSALIFFLFLAPAAAQLESDVCLRCERFGQSAGGGVAALGTPPLFSSGCYTGNATDDRTITIGGARPSACIVKKQSTIEPQTGALRHDGMAQSGDFSHQASPGSGIFANWIQAFVSTGFEVGTDQETNSSLDDYCYYCWENKPLSESYQIGRYIGDGATTQSISLRFAPSVVCVYRANSPGDGAQAHVCATTEMLLDGLSGSTMDGQFVGATSTVQFSTFDSSPPGFTVGTAKNTTGAAYFYMAFAEAPGFMTQGKYVGNDSTNREIVDDDGTGTGTPIPCQLLSVFLVAESAVGVDKCAGMIVDDESLNSHPWLQRMNSTDVAGWFLDFTATPGFRVSDPGASNEGCNDGSRNYYWWGFCG